MGAPSDKQEKKKGGLGMFGRKHNRAHLLNERCKRCGWRRYTDCGCMPKGTKHQAAPSAYKGKKAVRVITGSDLRSVSTTPYGIVVSGSIVEEALIRKASRNKATEENRAKAKHGYARFPKK